MLILGIIVLAQVCSSPYSVQPFCTLLLLRTMFIFILVPAACGDLFGKTLFCYYVEQCQTYLQLFVS